METDKKPNVYLEVLGTTSLEEVAIMVMQDLRVAWIKLEELTDDRREYFNAFISKCLSSRVMDLKAQVARLEGEGEAMRKELDQ